uniref:Reverse transcriptase domain-containing protein n=1 Tax=Strigamia maritima TaxID=126957 RepID=T1IR49_STRMM
MMKRIFEETRNCVRTEKGTTDVFWTDRGVRQGCPLSPILFSIFLDDLEENWTRWNIGGSRIGKWKIYCLKFADDVAIFAENVEGLQAMINDLERYVKSSKLIVNVNKSKIVVFRRGVVGQGMSNSGLMSSCSR